MLHGMVKYMQYILFSFWNSYEKQCFVIQTFIVNLFEKDFIPVIREQGLYSSLFSTVVSFPPLSNMCFHFATLLCEESAEMFLTEFI